MELPFERLEIGPMASGGTSLLLTEQVSWESFPEYADALLRVLDGAVVQRADGPVERVWTVRILGQAFWLAYDDVGVSLDPKDRDASTLVASIRQRLLDHGSRPAGPG